MSRKGSYLHIELFQSGMFGGTSKGHIDVDLKELANKCIIFDESKVVHVGKSE